MKKRLLLISLCVILAVLAFWMVNKQLKIIDLSTINVTADSGIDRSKIKIERGHFDKNRKTDSALFAAGAGKWTVFDGHQSGLLGTDNGDNDFLITYDNRYYLAFGHFITYGRFQHAYNFTFYKHGDTILVHAMIQGGDGEIFTRPMLLIADAGLPKTYIEFRAKFQKDKAIGVDSVATIPEELINSFASPMIDTSYPHSVEPLDWIANRYGNFFVIRVDCGAGGECANYYLLAFDNNGRFVRKDDLGMLAVDEGSGTYFDYKQLSDTTLRGHSSEQDEDPPTNNDSTWIISLKL